LELVNIVWNCNRAESWHSDWVEELFQFVPHKTFQNRDYNFAWNRSIIVDAVCYNRVRHNSYVSKLASLGLSFGFIHLTDETTQDDISSYRYCRFVLRNYFRSIPNANVLTIPLGWNNGYRTATHTRPPNREFLFSGVFDRMDPERAQLCELLDGRNDVRLYVVSDRNPRLAPNQVAAVYASSLFTICCNGLLSVDSLRISEALEAGSVPVVIDNPYWDKMYGADAPFLRVSSWHHLLKLSEDSTALRILGQQLQQRLVGWWASKLSSLKHDIKRLVEMTMS